MLIHVEHLWAENLFTAQGRVLHEKAHDPYISEKRGRLIITRAMPIVSYNLGLIGEADVVEFRSAEKSRSSLELKGREGNWTIMPVEYKRGKPKEEEHDRLQLCAQAICLEEMLNSKIDYAELFYWEVRSRIKVELDAALRENTRKMVREMHDIIDRETLPKWKPDKKKCALCSLKNDCIPVLYQTKNVRDYIQDAFREDEL